MDLHTPEMILRIGKSKKAFVAVQVVSLIVCAGALGGMFAFTDVYDEAYSRIVAVICLSCIKLDRVYSKDYEVFTANNNDQYHPEHILDDLETGVVFLTFRTVVCDYCDFMEPLVMEIFDIEFGMEDCYSEVVDFHENKVVFYHVNNDYATGDLKELQSYYDRDGYKGVPMFTIITLDYLHGITSPYYLTFYGVLDPKYTDEERIEEITKNVLEAIELWKESIAGYVSADFKK
jgi:hypothetical protein